MSLCIGAAFLPLLVQAVLAPFGWLLETLLWTDRETAAMVFLGSSRSLAWIFYICTSEHRLTWCSSVSTLFSRGMLDVLLRHFERWSLSIGAVLPANAGACESLSQLGLAGHVLQPICYNRSEHNR